MSSVLVCLLLVVVKNSIFVASQDLRPFMNTYVPEGGAPFVVYVISIIGNEEKTCTGTILDKNWILTLARCVPKNVNEANITVIANMNSYTDIKLLNEEDSQTRDVSYVIVNPYYKPEKLGGADLALLQVQKPLQENEVVTSAEVDVDGWPLKDGKPIVRTCHVIGYGDIDHTKRDNELKSRQVRVTHSSDCACARRNQWMSLGCLDPMEDVGLCPRDNGAPLICENKLVGVNHMLIVKKNCSKTNYPQDICGDLMVVSYFIYLCPYLNWIKETVVSIPTPTKYCNKARSFHQNTLLLVATYILAIQFYWLSNLYTGS